MTASSNNPSVPTAVVCGAGRMGQRYLKVLQTMGILVEAVCDPSDQSLSAAHELAPEAALYKDSSALFTKHRARLAIISSTASSHAPLSLQAAEHGAQFIVCEKPMATSIQEARAMAEGCKSRGVKLAINHQMRFLAQYTRVKELFASKEFGSLQSMTVVTGNCGLTMNGSHYVEALRFLSEDEPSVVTAWLENFGLPNPRGAQFVDQAGAWRIETKRGVRMYMELGAHQGHGMQVVYGGSFGQIFVDELQGALYAIARRPQDRELPMNRIGSEAVVLRETIPAVEMLESTRCVIEALLRGSPACSGEDGVTIVKTLVAAYLSHERGNMPVDISQPLPEERSFPWA